MSDLTLKSAKSLFVNLGGTIRFLEEDTDKIKNTIKAFESLHKDNKLVLNCLYATLYLNFIYLDFCAAYRLYLAGTTNYEQRYAVKQMYQIMNEGYKRLYGFDNPQDKSILSDTRKKSVWFTYMKFYHTCGIEEIQKEYNKFIENISAFENPIIFDKNSRSLCAHYSGDLNAIYDFLCNLNAEDVTKGATEFLRFMEMWRKFIAFTQTFVISRQV